MSRVLLIPAAGVGSRLRATVPKVLVPVNGRPMLDYLVELYQSRVSAFVVVAHPSFAEAVRAHVRALQITAEVVEQRERTGMLDAVLLAKPAVDRHAPDEVWITWGDQVGVLPTTADRLAHAMAERPMPSVALPTVRCCNPYTHFARDGSGRLTRFLQRREGDPMPEIGESDMGLFAMTRAVYDCDLPAYARDVAPGTETGERNFVPFVPWMASRGRVVTFPCTDQREAIGINTPEELHAMEAWLRARSA